MRIALAMLLIAFVGRSEPKGSIVGWVTDNRDAPLAAAHVDVTDNETGQVSAGHAKDDGRFVVSGLVVGHHYSILTRCIGYAPQRMAGVEPQPAGVKDAGHLAIFELAPIEVRLSTR
jgi:Carboxypeptidase regulatory-like domain